MKKMFARVLTIYALACFLHVAFDSTFALAQVDAMDMHKVTVADAPADVADWPITVAITELNMSTPAGLAFKTAPVLPDNWNYRIPGWDGDLQYTVWPVVRVNGQWYTSGIIQMWQGRESTGAPILTDFHINWAYSDRWGMLNQYFPKVGDQMGFFLTAGNARDEKAVTSKRERSNLVLVNLPAGDTGNFAFSPAPAPSDGNVDVVAQARADLAASGYDVNSSAACVDFEIAKIVAGRIPGAGLLTKDCCGDFTDPNRTHCEYKGQGYSHDIVAFADGSIADIAIGDGHNTASWQLQPPDASLVSRYRSAAALGLTGVVAGGSPVPTPTPVPVPPTVDLTPLLNDIAALKAQVMQLRQANDDLNRQLADVTGRIDGAVTAADEAKTGTVNLHDYLKAHPIPDGCRVSYLGCRPTFNYPPVQ